MKISIGSETRASEALVSKSHCLKLKIQLMKTSFNFRLTKNKIRKIKFLTKEPNLQEVASKSTHMFLA